MTVTDVTPILTDRYLFVKVSTSDGLVGWGEAGAWANLEACGVLVRQIGEYLVGQDPRYIEHHWQYVYRSYHFRGAVIMGALSAIDIALWDLAGKRFGVPVHELLGESAAIPCARTST
jgi:galactonate dehydratase